MVDQVKIVPMTRANLSQVLAIEKVSFPLPFSENLFHMELNLNIAHMMVACAGKTVMGYLDYWHVDNEMHVINIAVSLQARQKGIGSQLMQHVVDYGNKNGVEKIFLDVRESNASAIKLYKKFCFEPIDVRKGYYQDNEEDALVMQLKL